MSKEKKMSRDRAITVLYEGAWLDLMAEGWEDTLAGKELDEAIEVACECVEKIDEIRDLNSRYWEDDLR